MTEQHRGDRNGSIVRAASVPRIAAALLMGFAVLSAAAQTPSSDAPPDRDSATMRRDAVRFLLQHQTAEGAWAPQAGPGLTALVTKALIREPAVGAKHPAVRRAVAHVNRFRHDDGGIYSPSGLIKNYETATALSMFAAMQATGSDMTAQIESAQKFLIELQWDEGESIDPSNVFYGGAGYGRSERPDLSNTQFMLDALADSGLSSDHPTYQKALVFIRRCQMWGESNDQPYADGSTQGGFIYATANGGESKNEAGDVSVKLASKVELRAYGSMTYAGYKSMLYAGLSKDDTRVQAAMRWIAAHWTLDRNPGMSGKQSQQGLYYYYHTFARALRVAQLDTVTDIHGQPHDWRAELREALQKRQRPDGSWINAQDRWMEGIPELTTAYALLALQEAEPHDSE